MRRHAGSYRRAAGVGLLVLLIMALALGVRLASWEAAKGYAIRADELDYAIPAQRLTETGEYLDTYITHGRVWTRVPLQSLLLGAAFATQPQVPPGATTGDTGIMAERFAAGNLATIAVSLLLVPFVMALAAEAIPQRRLPAAILAGTGAALYPPLVSSSSQQLLSETLFITLFFAALFTLTRWRPRQWAVDSGQWAVDGEGSPRVQHGDTQARRDEGDGRRETRGQGAGDRGQGAAEESLAADEDHASRITHPSALSTQHSALGTQHSSPAWLWLALTGLLLGLSALARPVVLGFLPFLALWFWGALRASQTTVAAPHVREPKAPPGVGFSLSPRERVGVRGSSAAKAQPRAHSAEPTSFQPAAGGDPAPVSSPASGDSAPSPRRRGGRGVRSAGIFPTALRSFGLTALVGIFFLAAISPWTLYNYRQYGRLLLLDTANITAFWNYNNYRGENLDAVLAAYPNPADRQVVILREGLENILEHPDRFARNVLFSLGYAWHLELSSALLPNAWDLTQRDPDVPIVLPTDAAFLLVSLAGLAGLAGLGRRRPDAQAGRVRLALALWIAFMLALGAIIPYDARYRMPAAPALIVFAAALLAGADWRRVVDPRRWPEVLRGYPLVAGLALLLSAWVLVGAARPEIPGALRSLYLAWQAEQSGTAEERAIISRAAIAANPDSFWPYRHAAGIARRDGRDAAARQLYREALGRGEDPRAVLGLADLLYSHPDWELDPVETDWLLSDTDELRGAPWNSFRPTPRDSIEAGLSDLGYLQGFHPAERAGEGSYRWSSGSSEARIATAPGAPPATGILLRLAAPALGPPEPLPVTVRVKGSNAVILRVGHAWADYIVPLDPPVTGDLLVHIDSPVLTPRDFDPTSPDTRLLGAGLQWVKRVTGDGY